MQVLRCIDVRTEEEHYVGAGLPIVLFLLFIEQHLLCECIGLRFVPNFLLHDLEEQVAIAKLRQLLAVLLIE